MGDGVEWVLLIACEVRDAAKCTGQILITKNAPIPNANSAEVEKLLRSKGVLREVGRKPRERGGEREVLCMPDFHRARRVSRSMLQRIRGVGNQQLSS